jgi:hypothetical protein
MNVLRKGALNDACMQLATQVLTSSSGVSADLVETLAARFQHEALNHLNFVEGQGRDPNLLTRAVLYIADAHAIPPLATDVIWFRSMMDFAVELAVPNSGLSDNGFAFLADVRDGLAAER